MFGFNIFAIFKCNNCGQVRVFGNATPENKEPLIICQLERKNVKHTFTGISDSWVGPKTPLPPYHLRNINIDRLGYYFGGKRNP